MVRNIPAFALVFLFLQLSGCASNPSISSLTSQEREKVGQIVFLPSESIPSESYQILGSVEGLACKRNLYATGAPSFEEAQQGVRIRAAQLGADAVINLLCEENHKVDWVRNCWQSVVCVADAISVTDKSVLSRHKAQPAKTPSKSISVGTAWVVGANSIITNNHVIEGAEEITGSFRDGKKISLKVIAADPVNDLALLTPNQSIPLPRPLPIARSEAALGEAVFTVGYPHTDILGVNAKVTSGIVSANTGLRDDLRLYQTTVALQAGNSGGPLLNMKGEAIGVTTSKLDAVRVFRYTGDLPEGVNYAVKSHYITALMATMMDSNEMPSNRDRHEPYVNLQQAVAEVRDSILLIEAK